MLRDEKTNSSSDQKHSWISALCLSHHSSTFCSFKWIFILTAWNVEWI